MFFVTSRHFSTPSHHGRFVPPGAGPDRSFDIDPVVNPLRIMLDMLDMSDFDTGPVVDLENRDSLGVEDDSSVVRRLFLSESRDTSPNPESLDSTPHQVTFDPSLQPDVNEEVNNNGVDVSTAPAPAVAPPQESMPTMAGNSSQGAPRAVRQRHRKSYAKKFSCQQQLVSADRSHSPHSSCNTRPHWENCCLSQ